MPHSSALRIGTRGSPLARWQAEWVAGKLQQRGIEVALVPITTAGDQNQQGPIGAIGTQGVFTKEIQRALLDDRVDLAVHSLKDLPTDEVPGLVLAAVPPRAPVNDAFVSRRFPSFESLPHGAVLGTGSLRRRAQLLHWRPDLVMKDVRGNVDTRLRKLNQQQYDALVLAEAGLQRLGLAEQITQVLPMPAFLPAVGQGALGLETRADDHRTREAVAQLDHPATHAAVLAERAMLATLQGGCLAPIAAWGRIDGGRLVLTGRALARDGSQKLEATDDAEPADAVQLGIRLAQSLIAAGATELIHAAREAGEGSPPPM
ncbi:MAG: hydroxymethylbilane synthase [Thermoguttaceae bacterium]